MTKSRTGFTIVELLIVIVVIGILAAITIVAYNGVQNRANDASVSSDLTSISKQITMFNVDKGRFPKGPAELATIDFKVTTSAYSRGMYNGTNWYNLVYCWPNEANPYTFAVIAQSKSGQTLQAVDGSVTKASYDLSESSSTSCAAAGVPMDSSGNSDRDWFYDNDSWRSYATQG